MVHNVNEKMFQVIWNDEMIKQMNNQTHKPKLA
jgi:hypothetical protein